MGSRQRFIYDSCDEPTQDLVEIGGAQIDLVTTTDTTWYLGADGRIYQQDVEEDGTEFWFVANGTEDADD